MSNNNELGRQSSWTIEPHGNGYALYAGRDNMRHGMNLVYMADPDSNWESTKRLIEAVPEMLAALQRQHENIQQWLAGGPAAGPDESREIADQIREAIEKATMPVV